MSAAAFDAVARRYDSLWTRSPIGRLQRAAVWRAVDSLLQPGDSVLDLGCGTGEDALHLMERGVRVSAIDASPTMVEVARERGVDAAVLDVQRIGELTARFDGALSNFGALNCIERLDNVASGLAGLVRPGGYFVLCTIGRFCLRETLHYGVRFNFRKAIRRLRPRGARSSLGPVFYPSVRRLIAAFYPQFELLEWTGVGLCVPPSYIASISESTLAKLDAADRLCARRRLLRGLCDHRLLIFRRT